MTDTADYVHASIIPAVLALLPARLDSFEARAILIAIGLQESGFTARVQRGGPARGFWQFEEGGGVRGVLNHATARPLLDPVLQVLRYSPGECFDALPHNDVLACVFARLLLFTHPFQIPEDTEGAWKYYLDLWRPGKPRPETWAGYYQRAYSMVAE